MIQRDLADGIDYAAGEITVLELARQYLALKQNRRYNTTRAYRTAMNNLGKEDFAYLKINRVKPTDAKRLCVKMQEQGQGYSSISILQKILKPAFKMAIEDDAIRKNPFSFKLTDVIIDDREQRQPLTKEEQENLMSFIREDKRRSRYYNMILILLGTGLRAGELCGLTVSDIDFVHGYINVERQMQRTEHGVRYIEETKTESGTRKVPMSQEVANAFREAIAKRGIPKVEPMVDGCARFIFLDRHGQPRVAQQIDDIMRGIVNSYNKTHADQIKATPHVLRHTFCTNMAQAGIAVNALQQIMGHTDITITLRVYTHFDYATTAREFEKAIASL